MHDTPIDAGNFGGSFLIAAHMGSLLTDTGVYRPGIYRQIQDPRALLVFDGADDDAAQSPVVAFRALADYVWSCAMNGQTPEQIQQALASWHAREDSSTTKSLSAFPYLYAMIFLPDDEDPAGQPYLADTVSIFIEALSIAESIIPY